MSGPSNSGKSVSQADLAVSGPSNSGLREGDREDKPESLSNGVAGTSSRDHSVHAAHLRCGINRLVAPLTHFK